MPLTCELGNISPVTEHCVCKLCLHRRHPHYHFGNTNLNMTLNKSSNQKIFWHSTIHVAQNPYQ